jgi:hypothetical protein
MCKNLQRVMEKLSAVGGSKMLKVLRFKNKDDQTIRSNLLNKSAINIHDKQRIIHLVQMFILAM